MIKKIGNWFTANLKTVIIVLAVTFGLYALLLMNLLPTYSTSELEKKASYFFPLWVIIILCIYAYLDMAQDAIEKSREEKKETVEEDKEKNE